MTTEAAEPNSPPIYDRLIQALAASKPSDAIDLLIQELRDTNNYQALFYARLMRVRVERNLNPFPNSPATELPEEFHEEYEEMIREAAREAGQGYLQCKDFARAYGFFNLIGELEPLKEALAQHEPTDDEDTYSLIDIAWHQKVLPEKGFDWVLDRSGICSAITMVSSTHFGDDHSTRDYAVKKLIRALTEQLKERLISEWNTLNRPVPESATISELASLPELFSEDSYHIDVSHLASVIDLALQLPPCEELAWACELCDYGARLSPTFQGDGQVPFEKGYRDYKAFLEIILDINRSANIATFLEKAESEFQADGETLPAEILISLLLRIGEREQAYNIAKQFLYHEPFRDGACPNLYQLAQQQGDYVLLGELAEKNNDPVLFLAAHIAAKDQH